MNLFKPGFLKAVRNGDVENAEYYLKQDVMKYQNMTAMMDDKQAVHIAAENHDKKMIDLLCAYKGDLNAPRASFPYFTPLISVLYADHDQVHKEDTLAYKEDMLAYLCSKGANINFNHNGRETSHILFHMAASGSWALLPKLIELGVDLNMRPGLVAEMINRRVDNKIILAAIDAGANIDKHAKVDGEALRVLPTHMAAQTGNIDILAYLLDKGLSPDARSLFNNDSHNDEDSVIGRAFEDRSGKTLALLLKRGGDKQTAQREWKYIQQQRPSSEIQSRYGDISAVMNSLAQTAVKKEIAASISPPPLKETPVFKPPTPAAAVPAPEAPWKKLNDTAIAHTETMPALARRITEIFNFATCERRTITENLNTRMESTETQKFVEIDQSILRTAADEFEKQGGIIDRDRVFRRKGSGVIISGG